VILQAQPKLKFMASQFLGNDHFISLEEAKKMTKKFRGDKDKIVKDEYKGKHLLPNCESFDRAAFDKLLQREDCKGVRIYYGMKEEDKRVHAIIVGFDADGKDILPREGIVADGIDECMIENGSQCPPNCPPPSELNPPPPPPDLDPSAFEPNP
jgi:hypothetical protein